MKLGLEKSAEYSTEITWSKPEYKNEWSVKIDKAVCANDALEKILSIIYDLKPATLISIDEKTIKSEIQEIKKFGLKFFILEKLKLSRKGFSHTKNTYNNENNFYYAYKIVITKSDEIAHELENAFLQRDNIAVGYLLGYPENCCNFFNKVWNQGFVDPLWQQAENTSQKTYHNTNHIIINKASVHPFINSFLRYINIRLTSHIPCSLDCKESKQIALKRLELGKSLKLDGITELEELLTLETIWCAHNGKAIIATPFFKIRTSSVNCENEYLIHLK